METRPVHDPDQWLSSYQFELPPKCIAQRPATPRDHARLMVYHVPSREVEHSSFHQLHRYLPPGAPLILNDSKVFPCRLQGHKSSGGQAELFFLSRTSSQGLFPALVKCTGKKQPGDRYLIKGGEVGVGASGG